MGTSHYVDSVTNYVSWSTAEIKHAVDAIPVTAFASAASVKLSLAAALTQTLADAEQALRVVEHAWHGAAGAAMQAEVAATLQRGRDLIGPLTASAREDQQTHAVLTQVKAEMPAVVLAPRRGLVGPTTPDNAVAAAAQRQRAIASIQTLAVRGAAHSEAAPGPETLPQFPSRISDPPTVVFSDSQRPQSAAGSPGAGGSPSSVSYGMDSPHGGGSDLSAATAGAGGVPSTRGVDGRHSSSGTAGTTARADGGEWVGSGPSGAHHMPAAAGAGTAGAGAPGWAVTGAADAGGQWPAGGDIPGQFTGPNGASGGGVAAADRARELSIGYGAPAVTGGGWGAGSGTGDPEQLSGRNHRTGSPPAGTGRGSSIEASGYNASRGGSTELPFLPGLGGGLREEDREHKRPDWLIETEDIFGIGCEWVAPAVLGQDGPDPDDQDDYR